MSLSRVICTRIIPCRVYIQPPCTTFTLSQRRTHEGAPTWTGGEWGEGSWWMERASRLSSLGVRAVYGCIHALCNPLPSNRYLGSLLMARHDLSTLHHFSPITSIPGALINKSRSGSSMRRGWGQRMRTAVCVCVCKDRGISGQTAIRFLIRFVISRDRVY